jgi:hypothetical protein
MAINIISGNLNTWGDQGNFEADKSTWGFGDESYTGGFMYRYRENLGGFGFSPTKGIFVCAAFVSAVFNGPQEIAHARASLLPNKKYVCYAKVRLPAANFMGSDSNPIRINPDASADIINVVQTISTTVLAAKSNWITIETRFETGPSTSGNYRFSVEISNSGTSAFKYAFTDEFEIYQYTDVAPPACTLDINVGGSTVVANSGVSNGSIDIAITGGSMPIQYSINNGVSYQSGSLFTGLAPGPYVCRVLDVNGCTDTYTFVVNDSGYAFDFTTIPTNESVQGASDGSILVTPSGTGAPFTYSKNGGVSFQSSNIFTGLAPGVYTIGVKSTGGVDRFKSATVAAGPVVFNKAFFSKNPIVFSFLAPSNWQSLTNYRMYCRVDVEDVSDSGAYNSKFEAEIYPNGLGVCIFNLRPAFRSVFQPVPPLNQENVIKRVTDRIKRFVLKTGTLTDYLLVPLSTITSVANLALYGGLSTKAHAEVIAFDWIRTNKKFLTFQPDRKKVDIAQEDYLFYYVFDATTLAINLKATAYYDDGTNQTATVKTSATQHGHVMQLPAGATNSGVAAINPAKRLTSYELWLTNGSDVVISEVRTYLVKDVILPNTKYVMIVNSLGAHEVHLLLGDSLTRVEVAQQVNPKNLPAAYGIDDVNFEKAEASLKTSHEYSSGYLTGENAAEWHAYFVELLLSKYFLDVTDGVRRKKIVTTSELVTNEDKVYDRFIRFEAMDVFEDYAYSNV